MGEPTVTCIYSNSLSQLFTLSVTFTRMFHDCGGCMIGLGLLALEPGTIMPEGNQSKSKSLKTPLIGLGFITTVSP